MKADKNIIAHYEITVSDIQREESIRTIARENASHGFGTEQESNIKEELEYVYLDDTGFRKFKERLSEEQESEHGFWLYRIKVTLILDK